MLNFQCMPESCKHYVLCMEKVVKRTVKGKWFNCGEKRALCPRLPSQDGMRMRKGGQGCSESKAKSAVTASCVTMVLVEGSLNLPPFRPHVSREQQHNQDGFPAERHDQRVL